MVAQVLPVHGADGRVAKLAHEAGPPGRSGVVEARVWEVVAFALVVAGGVMRTDRMLLPSLGLML